MDNIVKSNCQKYRHGLAFHTRGVCYRLGATGLGALISILSHPIVTQPPALFQTPRQHK